MRLTDPGYISQQMFDNVLRDKFHENPDDKAVRQQAIKLLRLFAGSRSREQIHVDIAHAANVSGWTAKEQQLEIAFCMGLQFGFELALSHPPTSGGERG